MTTLNDKTLYLVVNEEGEITADVDRAVAIERMADDHGGEVLRVVAVTVRIPAYRDQQVTLTLPSGTNDRIEVSG